MKKNENKENVILGRAGQTIDLIKFNTIPEQEQYNEVEKVLKEIYQEDLNISKSHIMKCIRLTCNPKDEYIFLPHNLKISKEKLSLKFEVAPKKPLGTGWVIFSVWVMLFTIIAATYAGFSYLDLANLNKDIDGDGIADINIDINNDKKPDINIDIDDDDIPDVNIDYKGNRKAVFNIDTDGDGIADSNLITYPDKEGKCGINCDTNNDGWPDLNLDLDGDGIPDSDVDTDGDGVPDINLDINGDGICDLLCDEDGDGKCDTNCIKPEVPEEIPNPQTTKPVPGPGSTTTTTTIATTTTPKTQNSGSSVQNGDNSAEVTTSYLMINYSEGITVQVSGILPDDQPPVPGYEHVKPIKEFTIENLSDYPAVYSLKWVVNTNTFITNNLKYKIDGTNGGPTLGYRPIPKISEMIYQDIVIPPRVTQKYRLEINLEGTGTEQNEDQGKKFLGYIEVVL